MGSSIRQTHGGKGSFRGVIAMFLTSVLETVVVSCVPVRMTTFVAAEGVVVPWHCSQMIAVPRCRCSK